jgi:predicted HD phosphohydrolase
LRLQGGAMNDEEAKEFQKEKFFYDSIKLRKFDEAAKKTGVKMKDINDYKNLLNSNLL